MVEYSDHLPLSVLGRLTATHNILSLLLPLVTNRPWIRQQTYYAPTENTPTENTPTENTPTENTPIDSHASTHSKDITTSSNNTTMTGRTTKQTVTFVFEQGQWCPLAAAVSEEKKMRGEKNMSDSPCGDVLTSHDIQVGLARMYTYIVLII